MTIVFPDTTFVKPNGFTRNGLFLDPVLKANLDNYLIRGVKKGHDGIILITGLEGTGKSTLAQLLATYCDSSKKLSVDRVVFSGRDLMKCIDNAKPETSIVFDEAIMSMSSQDFATEMQKILIKKFTLIRKKRLFIFIVIPSIFMLRRYFAIFRTRAMINCICPDGITRGFFRFYSFTTKKKVYLRGQKEMNMGAVRCDFSGRFVDSYGFFVDAEEYEDKKDEAIRKLTEEDETPEEQLKMAFEDYKLKLKIDVDKYKGKWKDKFGAQKAKYDMKFKELKKKYASDVTVIKTEAITLQKSNDKKKIALMDVEYGKLMSFMYEFMENDFTTKCPGSQFTPNTFRNLLLERDIIKIPLLKVNKYIKDGQDAVMMEQTLNRQ